MPPWAAIGKFAPIPAILDGIPLFAHWALCVIDAEDVDPTSPSSRQLFVDAAYFDLGVLSSNGTASDVCCKSDSYGLHETSPRWPEYLVRTISTVQSVGTTSQHDEWIQNIKSQLDGHWGDYLPLLWNCQVFAVMLAQIVVGTVESTTLLRQIVCSRNKSIDHVRGMRGAAGMATLRVAAFFPVAGPFIAFGAAATEMGYTVTDAIKKGTISSKTARLVREHPQLRPVFGQSVWRRHRKAQP